MKNSSLRLHALRWSATLLLLALMTMLAQAASHKSETWARSQFETAERLRETLNSRPITERTRHQYQQVIDAYRRIYFGLPTSSKADPSAVAVADLMVDMGRRFHDNAILRKAIRQYEFLRREYPTSRSRIDALYAIGEIYQDDLKETTQAKAIFEEFLKAYPRHHLADDVRQMVKRVGQPAPANVKPEVAAAAVKKPQAATPENSVVQKTAGEVDNGVQNVQPVSVTGIQHTSNSDYTRITINLGDDVKFQSQRLSNPDRIYFDLAETKLSRRLNGRIYEVGDSFLKKIRIAQFGSQKTRIVLEVVERTVCEAFLVSDPPRLVIDVHNHASSTAAASVRVQEPSGMHDSPASHADTSLRAGIGSIVTAGISTPPVAEPVVHPQSSSSLPMKKIVEADDDNDDIATTSAEPESKRTSKNGVTPASERSKVQISRSIREARPTANGDRSLIRALGLKIGKIVIDAGHGGHDTGTIGPKGLQEKDLVLDVSLRLGILLKTRLGAEVEYTRDDDTFIPLETRTAIANQNQADLFISIHANSSRDPDARGVETYYLNFTSSRDALEVAARENAVSDQSIHELQDLVKKIALKEKIEESREFAANVEDALHSGLSAKNPGLRNRGVKKAPFIVLIGANMPSILAEISFVSNPADERRLKTAEYRQRIAESLYRGIAKYVSGLSGVNVASKIDKNTGQ